jgi:hypothetical protein
MEVKPPRLSNALIKIQPRPGRKPKNVGVEVFAVLSESLGRSGERSIHLSIAFKLARVDVHGTETSRYTLLKSRDDRGQDLVPFESCWIKNGVEKMESGSAVGELYTGDVNELTMTRCWSPLLV